MARILIVFGIIFGLGFWITSKNEEKNPNEEKTEVTAEEKSENEAVENGDKKEETDEEAKNTEENEKTNENVSTPKSTEVNTTVSKETPVVKKEVMAYTNSEVKVFLYEWGIDVSKNEVPTGNVVFNVVNNGKFTHEFVIGGVKNYGKVLPGEKKQFSVMLRPGTFEIHSKRRDDYERNMKEMFKVVR